MLCDLDGVVWLAHQPIPGSVEALATIRSSGRRVLFVTNNSASTRADQEAALASIGVPADGDVVSSAMAAARLVAPGERVLVAGGPGVREALADRGVDAVVNDATVSPDGFDAVIVGLHRSFDYARLSVAAAAVRSGARLIGTNTDPTYPTPEGLQPGGGSILAAIATAAGVSPTIGGKPHQPMADLIVEIVAPGGAGFDAASVLMVGDRLDTDGLFARNLGCRFALVRSGVTPSRDSDEPDQVPDLQPGLEHALDAADLAAVAAVLVSSSEREG